MFIGLTGLFFSYALVAEGLNEEAKKELKLLQGDWAIHRIELRNETQNPQEKDRQILTIKESKFILDGQEKSEIVQLDPSTKPKSIDIKNLDPTVEDAVYEGIYKLEGDTLTISIHLGKEKKRPTTFDTPTEEGTILVTLKRVKKEK
jgi:uncharacterized protein (TIGR03067 family)